MNDETPDVGESQPPLDVSDVEEAPWPPLDESPYEVQPLDVEERSLDRDGFERASATEELTDVVPAGLDPDESPFALQPFEGLPFDEDSEEARAIREVIEQAELERSEASRLGSAAESGRL